VSPRVPIRLLSMFLLLIAVIDAIAARVGLWAVFGYTTALVMAVLTVVAVSAIREMLLRGEITPWDFPRHAAWTPVSDYSRSRSLVPGIQEAPASRRSRESSPAAGFRLRLPEILAFARGMAVIFLVVTSTIALRTMVALEMLQ